MDLKDKTCYSMESSSSIVIGSSKMDISSKSIDSCPSEFVQEIMGSTPFRKRLKSKRVKYKNISETMWRFKSKRGWSKNIKNKKLTNKERVKLTAHIVTMNPFLLSTRANLLESFQKRLAQRRYVMGPNLRNMILLEAIEGTMGTLNQI